MAEFNGNGSLVKNDADVSALWRHGCYGKGILSRSRADRLRGKGAPKKPTPENPFHGKGNVRPLNPVLGIDSEPAQLTPEETIYLMHVEVRDHPFPKRVSSFFLPFFCFFFVELSSA